jgi:hypothetical protein
VVGRGAGFLAPPLEFITALLSFSLIASIAIAMLAAVLARRFSAAGAKHILRAAFLTLLLALAFGSRFLPESVTLPILDRFNTRTALTHLAWEASAIGAAIVAILLPVFAKIPMAENPREGGG